MDFDMKISLYKGVQTGTSIVEEACVNFIDLNDSNELFSKICTDSAFAIDTNLTPTLIEDETFTSSLTISQLPSVPSSLVASEPLNGSVSITLGGTLTSSDGIISSTGSWTYTPDSDYSGMDSFNIDILGEFGRYRYPVSVTVTAQEDATDDSTTCASAGGTVDIDVSTNDLFEGPVVYSVAVGGDPTEGSVVVLDANAGTFRYTSDLASNPGDVVTFTYRATPVIGTSEVGTVTITLT